MPGPVVGVDGLRNLPGEEYCRVKAKEGYVARWQNIRYDEPPDGEPVPEEGPPYVQFLLFREGDAGLLPENVEAGQQFPVTIEAEGW